MPFLALLADCLDFFDFAEDFAFFPPFLIALVLACGAAREDLVTTFFLTADLFAAGESSVGTAVEGVSGDGAAAEGVFKVRVAKSTRRFCELVADCGGSC